jgi:hypothetical protein
MEVNGQLHKAFQNLVGQEAGWDPEPSWTLWRGKHFCPLWESNPQFPAHTPYSIVTLLAELSSRHVRYVGKSISMLQIDVGYYMFELGT